VYTVNLEYITTNFRSYFERKIKVYVFDISMHQYIYGASEEIYCLVITFRQIVNC